MEYTPTPEDEALIKKCWIEEGYHDEGPKIHTGFYMFRRGFIKAMTRAGLWT